MREIGRKCAFFCTLTTDFKDAFGKGGIAQISRRFNPQCFLYQGNLLSALTIVKSRLIAVDMIILSKGSECNFPLIDGSGRLKKLSSMSPDGGRITMLFSSIIARVVFGR